MKILLCLDCDGTLYTTVSLIPPVRVAQKPIPLSRLEELEAAQCYPSDFYIYLSDNVGDDDVSRQAGFSYIHPDNFR